MLLKKLTDLIMALKKKRKKAFRLSFPQGCGNAQSRLSAHTDSSVAIGSTHLCVLRISFVCLLLQDSLVYVLAVPNHVSYGIVCTAYVFVVTCSSQTLVWRHPVVCFFYKDVGEALNFTKDNISCYIFIFVIYLIKLYFVLIYYSCPYCCIFKNIYNNIHKNDIAGN